MKNCVIGVAIFVLALSLTGCATAPSLEDDKELAALVQAFQRNAEEKKKRVARLGKGIKKLVIEKKGDDFNVSADLKSAMTS